MAEYAIFISEYDCNRAGCRVSLSGRGKRSVVPVVGRGQRPLVSWFSQRRSRGGFSVLVQRSYNRNWSREIRFVPVSFVSLPKSMSIGGLGFATGFDVFPIL